jgi:hypothetical protein
MISAVSLDRPNRARRSTPAPLAAGEGLRHLFNTHPVARALLAAASDQTIRAWRETAIATARAAINRQIGQSVPKKAVLEVFKKLQDLGVVRHIVGRSGHQTRIEWIYRSPSVAAVAAGRAAEFEKWGQSEQARRRRKQRLAKRSKTQPSGDGTTSMAVVDARQVKTAAPDAGARGKAPESQVVLNLGCGIAVTWNRPRNPTRAEAEKFAKAVAATVQSLAGGGA